MAIPDDQADPFNLDALAVSDRFRLFGFTRREDYLAYLWVLRGLDRLRAAHVAQAHSDDVSKVLAELAAHHDSVPRTLTRPRDRLDNLTDDGLLHRLEDASRAGSLARYRNRQSVYQFSELDHRAYTAVEGVLLPGSRTRTCPGWCSRTSCATCRGWPRRTGPGTATRSCGG